MQWQSLCQMPNFVHYRIQYPAKLRVLLAYASSRRSRDSFQASSWRVRIMPAAVSSMSKIMRNDGTYEWPLRTPDLQRRAVANLVGSSILRAKRD
eukprot:5933587-Pleurochrysis_carterae.AAC.5